MNLDVLVFSISRPDIHLDPPARRRRRDWPDDKSDACANRGSEEEMRSSPRKGLQAVRYSPAWAAVSLGCEVAMTGMRENVGGWVEVGRKFWAGGSEGREREEE